MPFSTLPKSSRIKSALQSSAAKDAAIKAEDQAVSDRYEAERQPARDALTSMLGTAAPTMDQNTEFRQAQTQLLQQLAQRAQGQGPSIAQQQFQQAGNAALQKSMGAIRAATGGNAALAGRTAALGGTNMLGNLAAESGMARLKEQQDAQAALGQLSAQGRQQDTTVGAANMEALLKTIAARQAAADQLLGSAATRYEGHYNRGAQVQAAKAGQKQGQSDSDFLKGLIATGVGGYVSTLGGKGK